MDYLELAQKNQSRAHEIIEELKVPKAWEQIGARVYMVGSLKSGLLVKNRDIDFHVYTDRVDIEESFDAVRSIASNPRIKSLQYGNLIDTEEECIEWHLIYEGDHGEKWKLDMIHIRKGSAYDGMVETATEAIMKVLTPETRHAIMRIKYMMPEHVTTMGIEIYKAVIADGIRDIEGFIQWKKDNPTNGILTWIPKVQEK